MLLKRFKAGLATAAVTVAAVTAVSERTSAEPAAPMAPASLVETTITAAEWNAYRGRFIASEGRVIDIEKNGVTHSEGQAYGMLLAVRADDRKTFDRILRFTWRNMRGRADGLLSWLYNPHTYPRIVDANNASDGDIIIAYALVAAAVKWNEPRYIAVAAPLVDAIGRHLLERRDGLVRVRPAAFGFEPAHHEDGPVVNLSYYIYGAFLLFEAIDDEHPWLEAWQSGLRLTEASLAGRHGLSPDWITMADERYLEPANGFAKKSSYDAVRIPLYMAMGGRVPERYFASFDRAWNMNNHGMPKDYDFDAGKLMNMNEPGYKAIAAIAACAARGKPLPHDVRRFEVRTYFSSSLHLLALSAVRANYKHCLDDPHVVVAGDPQTVSYFPIASR